MEILLAVLGNLKTVTGGVLVALFVVSIFGAIPISVEGHWRLVKPYVRPAMWFVGVCLLILCVPSVDDLWRVRIGLIKYELASPENLRAATDTIERIGKKLECKYLGCDEESK